MSLDTETDNVIVVTEDDIERIANGEFVKKEGKYRTNLLHNGDDYPPSHMEGQPRFFPVTKGNSPIDTSAAGRIRDGQVVTYGIGGREKVEFIHEDYAGTPKDDSVVVQWLFEQFKQSDGEARQIAQETLHKMGFEVEKSVEYELVEK